MILRHAGESGIIPDVPGCRRQAATECRDRHASPALGNAGQNVLRPEDVRPEGEHAMSSVQYTVRVLGIHEDGEWCAIALEMSLRGYGSTFREALADLSAAMEAQLSFAVQYGTLDNIWVPAEPHYVQLYEKARREGIRHFLAEDEEEYSHKDEYAAADLALPRADKTGFEAMA